MNWYGSGFIPIILYAHIFGGAAAQNDFLLLDGTNFLLLNGTPLDLLGT